MLKECFGFVGLLKLTQRTEQDMIFFAKSSNDSSSNKPKMHRLLLHSSANRSPQSSRLLWDILGHLQEYSCGNSSRHQQQRFLAWREVRKMLVVSCILAKMCKVVWADPPATHLRFLWEVGCDYQHDWCSTCVLYCYSSKSYEIRLKNPLKILKKLNTQTCCMTGSLGKWYPLGRDKRNEAGVTRIKKAGMHRSVPTATGCNGR